MSLLLRFISLNTIAFLLNFFFCSRSLIWTLTVCTFFFSLLFGYILCWFVWLFLVCKHKHKHLRCLFVHLMWLRCVCVFFLFPLRVTAVRHSIVFIRWINVFILVAYLLIQYIRNQWLLFLFIFWLCLILSFTWRCAWLVRLLSLLGHTTHLFTVGWCYCFWCCCMHVFA